MLLPDITEQQMNIILNALGQRPFIEVAELIDKIAKSIQEQKMLINSAQRAINNGVDAEIVQ